MRRSLDQFVRERAGNVCEYCKLPQSIYGFRFPLDHIIAEQHGGKTISSNLCLACPRCNASKGRNIAGIDPISGRMVRLFNPRRHKWAAHFRWDGAYLQGKSGIGRTTILVLAMNHPIALELRRALIDSGWTPQIVRPHK
ncbi:MAG TPA: HNH endonuclease signature motif containing protein [Pirellulales bacterium]|nr:HNH endonuclease signature motif containing protein [Pirellulales bacterium]